MSQDNQAENLYQKELRWFGYSHLAPNLQALSQPFYDLAHRLVCEIGAHAEPAMMKQGLFLLWEAKNAIIMSHIMCDQRRRPTRTQDLPYPRLEGPPAQGPTQWRRK